MEQYKRKKACFIRLSAIGDCINALFAIQYFQANHPEYDVYWIIGKNESNLFSNIPNINFIVFNKKNGIKEYLKIRKLLSNIFFDVVFDMQSALRASFVALLLKSKIKIGFNKERSMDFQWLFVNKQIKKPKKEHVLDGFLSFASFLDNKAPEEKITTNFYLLPEDISLSQKLITANNTVVITPCTSKKYKNWLIDGYVEIIKYIIMKGFNIIIASGPSSYEVTICQNIENKLSEFSTKITNISGKTSLKQLLAIIDKAYFVISPDSGPVHMANAVNTPIIGLYAHHNPLRVGPYNYLKYAVSVYEQLITEQYPNKDLSQLSWRTRVHDEHAMSKITTNMVKNKIDMLLQDLEEKKI